MTDFGVDATGAMDLTWDLSTYDDGINAGSLLDSLARRVSTRYGSLFYAPSWISLDLYDYIGSTKPGIIIQSEIARVLEADEAVDLAEVTATVTGDSVAIVCKIDTKAGPFEFVASVDRAAAYIFNEVSRGA